MASSNLLLRILSAAVGLPLLALLVFWREPWGFAAISLLAAALALAEYGALTLGPGHRWSRAALVVVGTTFAAAVYLRPQMALLWAMAALVSMAMAVVLSQRDPADLSAAIHRLALAGFGVFYVGGLVVGLPLMHRDLEDGSLWVTIAVAVTFANDTGAYFTGRTLGRHKLAPANVSPGKTVEGAIGGLVIGVAFLFIARATFFPALTAADAAIIGLAAGVLGPTGDLLESMIKRAAGAKDSGRLIPGHGGILDRIDAVLFVGAFVYAYAVYFR